MSIYTDILVTVGGTVSASAVVATAKFLRDVAKVTRENERMIRGHPDNEEWDGLVELTAQNAERIEQHEDRLDSHEDRLETVEEDVENSRNGIQT